MRFEEKKIINGSPQKEYFPNINAGEQWATNFKELEIYFPLNYAEITNRTNDTLIYYLDSKKFTIYPNETIEEKTVFFEHFRVIAGSNPIAEGDLRIVVKRQGLNSDLKAKQDYKQSFRNKFFNLLRI